MVIQKINEKIILYEGACNTYYIDDEKKVLVDAGFDFLGSVDILVITHFHPDHILFVKQIKERSGCKVFIGFNDREPLEIIKTLWPSYGDYEVANFKPDSYLSEGNEINTGSFNFKVLEVPGHTIGSIALWEENKKILFTGDTLFAHNFTGRVDFPYSDAQSITESVERLKKLKAQLILPGHDEIVKA